MEEPDEVPVGKYISAADDNSEEEVGHT